MGFAPEPAAQTRGSASAGVQLYQERQEPSTGLSAPSGPVQPVHPGYSGHRSTRPSWSPDPHRLPWRPWLPYPPRPPAPTDPTARTGGRFRSAAGLGGSRHAGLPHHPEPPGVRGPLGDPDPRALPRAGRRFRSVVEEAWPDGGRSRPSVRHGPVDQVDPVAAPVDPEGPGQVGRPAGRDRGRAEPCAGPAPRPSRPAGRRAWPRVPRAAPGPAAGRRWALHRARRPRWRTSACRR